jgi:glycosyltransferase involved in cell wall biosynthesis
MDAGPAALSQDQRPGFAIISNSLPPYRVNLHKLIAAGIPELKLHTLVTHGDAEFVWSVQPPAEIHATHYGRKGDSPLTGTFRTPLYEWRKGGRMLEYLRSNNVQVVMLNGYRYISYLRVIDHFHRHEMPVFVRSDSSLPRERGVSPLKQFFKRRAYDWWVPRVSGVMSMGTLGDKFFLKYGANPRYLYRVPCWPDYEAFAHADPVGLEGFRRKYGLSRERHYVLFSGRLHHNKRVDLLIDAFAAIAGQRADWDLLIVGDGALGDELRRRVPEALRSRVVWTGFVDGEEPVLAYHAADVLVLPSDLEPWALVIQEAMAAGLAVVSSDASGAAHDLIDDEQSGRIFPAGDLAELKRAMLQVTDPEALSRFKHGSRAALDRWIARTDPIAEIRRALTEFGVLKSVGV